MKGNGNRIEGEEGGAWPEGTDRKQEKEGQRDRRPTEYGDTNLINRGNKKGEIAVGAVLREYKKQERRTMRGGTKRGNI